MSTQAHRLPSGGRVDRGTVLTFTVDGVEHTGHPGDTVASALIAAGRLRVGDSIYLGRPRGILAAGSEHRDDRRDPAHHQHEISVRSPPWRSCARPPS